MPSADEREHRFISFGRGYPLVNVNKKLLKMTIGMVDLPTIVMVIFQFVM
jgi:hypothetical protein